MNFNRSCLFVTASYLLSVLFEVISIFAGEWISTSITIIEPMNFSFHLFKACKKQEGLPVACKAYNG